MKTTKIIFHCCYVPLPPLPFPLLDDAAAAFFVAFVVFAALAMLIDSNGFYLLLPRGVNETMTTQRIDRGMRWKKEETATYA